MLFRSTYGLTDDQVETMILDSFDHAEEDFRQRQVVEARIEAETIINALVKGKKNAAWAQLSADEKQTIDRLVLALEHVKCKEDYKAIQAATSDLNKATTRLAELMMESAVSTVLHGKTMTSAADDLGVGPTAPHPFAPAEVVDKD